MGNSFCLNLCRIILLLSFSTWLTEGLSRDAENEILYNDFTEVELENENRDSTLDTIRHSSGWTDWTISESSQGFANWFEYFNNTSEIPEDVDFGGKFDYEVGFPRNFTKEPFLDESDADGIWMMVHAIHPPNLDDPVAHIDFRPHMTPLREFDTINITCYLNGNSSLVVKLSNNEIHTFDNDLKQTSKDDWDIFSIESLTPFKNFRLEIQIGEEAIISAFVMVEKIVVMEVPTNTITTTKRPNTNYSTSEITIPTSTDEIVDDGDDSESTTASNSTNVQSSFMFNFCKLVLFYIFLSL